MTVALLWSVLLLVGTFTISAVSKISSWPAFCVAIRSYQIVPPAHLLLAARLTVAAELAAAVLMLAPVTRMAGLLLAAGLLVVFSAAVASVVLRSIRTPCGCFDSSTEPAGWRHVVRNAALFLVACAGAVLAMETQQPFRVTDFLVAAAVAAPCLAVVIFWDTFVAQATRVRT